AHVPFLLGVLWRWKGATRMDQRLPPHPAHGRSWGRGGAAWVRAMLAGHHALYKVGQGLEERGMIPLLQPGRTRTALQDSRVGHLREALCAAKLNQGVSVVARKALAGEALPTPWLPQETTPRTLSGASADDQQVPGAPRPPYGHSPDGRDDRTQVLLRLGGARGGRAPPARGPARWQPQ